MPKIEIGSRFLVPGRFNMAIGGHPLKFRTRFPGTINQILLVMKLTMLLITIAVMSVNANVTAQNVSISGKELKLEQVFAAIKQQTSYVVFTSRRDLAGMKPVSLHAVDMPIRELLDLVLDGTSLEYTITDKTIILSRKPDPVPQLYINPAERPIVIQVRGSDGKLLAGASIYNKKTKRSGMTGADGTLQFNANSGDVLEISFVGYEKQSITVKENETTLNILLVTEENKLNEIVVNKGYYTEKKRLSTGNISRITSAEIANQPVMSPLLALQGRMPGVDITPRIGVPGTAPKIRIRGFNGIRGESFDGSGTPLIVIDGVMMDARPLRNTADNGAGAGYDPLGALNTENIAAVEVLKDADATAIYGSRGANGVILITTKKGQPGKVTADINVYQGAGKIVERIDMLETPEYLEMRRESFANAGMTPDEYNAPELTLWDQNKNTNWQNEFLNRAAGITDVQMNASGGNQQLNFRAGVGYHREGTIMPGDWHVQRLNGQLAMSYQSPNSRLKIDASMNFGSTRNKQFESFYFYGSVLFLAPNAPDMLNPDGSINWGPNGNGSYAYNAYGPKNIYAMMKNTNDTKLKSLILGTTASYKISNNLYFRTTLSYADSDNEEYKKLPLSAWDPVYVVYAPGGQAQLTTNKRYSWTIEPQLTYGRSIGRHRFDALVGMTFQNEYMEETSILATGYKSDVLLNSIRSAPSYSVSFDNSALYRYAALTGRIGYNYDEKYILNLTGRRDGSSRFGDNNKFGNFGAIGAAWVISGENFFRNNVRALSLAKLRASYGITGSDRIGDYMFYNTYSTTYFPYNGGVNLAPTALFNPDYKWEKTQKIEGALELGFLDDRIVVDVAYYRNRTSNQLIDYSLPETSGFTSILLNMPATIENRGWEFTFNTQNIVKKDFRWTSSFNFTKNMNVLLRFDELARSPYASYLIVGESVFLMKMYRSLGVDPQTGLYRVEDADKNGVIDNDDMIVIRPTERGLFGGLNNTFAFSDLDISFLIQGGQQYVGTAASSIYNIGYGASNIPVELWEGRWKQPGDHAKYTKPNMAYDPSISDYANSDAKMENIRFARLKTLSIGYNFPAPVIQRIGLSSLRVFLQGQNLLTVSNSSSPDPEVAGSYVIPPLRMLTIGANVKF